MSTKHPLVGKKLVAVDPQCGEVTEAQIMSSFDKVHIDRMGSWESTPTGIRWTVTVGFDGVIHSVTRT